MMVASVASVIVLSPVSAVEVAKLSIVAVLVADAVKVSSSPKNSSIASSCGVVVDSSVEFSIIFVFASLLSSKIETASPVSTTVSSGVELITSSEVSSGNSSANRYLVCKKSDSSVMAMTRNFASIENKVLLWCFVYI